MPTMVVAMANASDLGDVTGQGGLVGHRRPHLVAERENAHDNCRKAPAGRSLGGKFCPCRRLRAHEDRRPDLIGNLVHPAVLTIHAMPDAPATEKQPLSVDVE